MLTNALSASSLIKLFVSNDAFLRSIFTMLSRYGSMHRFNETSMSFMVSKATFETEDLRDSASLRSWVTMKES